MNRHEREALVSKLHETTRIFVRYLPGEDAYLIKNFGPDSTVNIVPRSHTPNYTYDYENHTIRPGVNYLYSRAILQSKFGHELRLACNERVEENASYLDVLLEYDEPLLEDSKEVLLCSIPIFPRFDLGTVGFEPQGEDVYRSYRKNGVVVS